MWWYWSWGSSVSIVTKLGARPPGFDFRQGQGLFLFVIPSRHALEPPIQWVRDALYPGVRRPGRETCYTSASSAEVRNAWSFISTPSYVFMAWYWYLCDNNPQGFWLVALTPTFRFVLSFILICSSPVSFYFHLLFLFLRLLLPQGLITDSNLWLVFSVSCHHSGWFLQNLLLNYCHSFYMVCSFVTYLTS